MELKNALVVAIPMQKEELQIKACSELGDMFVDYRNKGDYLRKEPTNDIK